jgi:hypothetical protein
MRALHRDHASRHDRPLGFYRDESPRIDVEAHSAGDAGLRRPLAIGSQQFGDEEAVQDTTSARGDLTPKLTHRDFRLILHAADIHHAAASEAADRAIRIP